ncbi:MAG: family 20 glycosylhydrolase [Coprobacillaceae bacterium]
MRKCISVVLVTLCIIALSGVQVNAEDQIPIISNGSFEEELVKDDIQTYKAKRVDANEGKVKDGNYAIKVGAEAPAVESEGYPLWLYNGGKGMTNVVIRNIKPNTKYVVKASYYNETGVSMRMGVLDIEGNNKWEQGRLNSNYKNYSGVSTEWNDVSFEITTGPRSTELYAFALTNWTGGTTSGAGVFYVDDFSIEEIEQVTPPVEETIGYSNTDENGFPFTTPMIQNFIPTENAEAFHIDKRNQLFYSDEFSWGKTEYLAQKLVEKGIINNYRLEKITDTPPTEGIVVTNQAISFNYPEKLDNTKIDAYEIHVSENMIQVNSAYIEGIQNGTMTLLQAFVQRDSLPAGKVEDYAETKTRGLQVDSGRRYYSVEWIKNEIEQMAYQKLNTMQLRLKDNEGIRYESKVAPTLVDTAGGYWTQEEVKEIVNYARQFNIEIIPEVDLPGHSEQDGEMVDESWLLSPGTNVLDFSNPDVQKYMADIYKEAFDLFEADTVHMGGDEYFQTSGYTDPDEKLSTWAKTETGNENATEYDAFKLFFNKLAKPYLDEGKTVLIWNDNIKNLNGPVPLDKRIVIDFWGGTMYGSIKASTTLQEGYKTLGSPANLYHDLWPENDKLDRPLPKFLYNDWLINTYSTAWTYEHVADELMGNSLGQMFPIWDDAHGFAPEYILSRTLFPRLMIFSNTLWGADRTTDGTSKLSFEEYELLSYRIGVIDDEAFKQVGIEYTDQDVELVINKIEEKLNTQKDNKTYNEERMNALQIAIDKPDGEEGNSAKIYEIIRLYENLSYQLPVYGDITIHYEDDNGKELDEKTVLTSIDSEDGKYKATPKEIKDYTFNKIKDGSALEEGYFNKTEKEITYIYTKNETPTPNPNDKPDEGKGNASGSIGATTSTSDTMNMTPYIFTLLGVGLIVGYVIYTKKKETNKNK